MAVGAISCQPAQMLTLQYRIQEHWKLASIFWCTSIQILGTVGENVKRGGLKKRKEISFFLKKETQLGFESPLTKSRSGQIICKLKYFLSRGQNAVRHYDPTKKIRGLLESSPNVGGYFQPCAFVEFPVGQEIAQVGWAVPSDCETLNGNVTFLIVGGVGVGSWGLLHSCTRAFGSN
jgi:hypothetical protein